ncbi:MAG: hypothetical protein IPL26_30165 [Leptospiraceae bacterium]|nr:hypothetical protein [Leptospiraceae bacterium]
MKERIKNAINLVGLSNRKFSLSIGNCHAWASMLLSENADSLKAKDILEMERIHYINPLYILKGELPIFNKKVNL